MVFAAGWEHTVSRRLVDHDARVGHDQLLALIDNTSAVIYMRDLNGRYMLINREYERLFAVSREDIIVSREDIIGRTDHDLFPADVADAFRSNDQTVASAGRPRQFEETAPSQTGMNTYVTVKFPLIDNGGQPYAVCGISTDITDRKRAEEQVQALNAELEQRVRERTAELEASTHELDAFAYSVSHDLRAPLRSLNGFSQVLLDDYGDRLDEAMVAPGLMVAGDTHLLRLVVQNLAANAWKFTANTPDARIEFGRVDEGGKPAFFVADNGAGFDMRYADKLFEPFQRLHPVAAFDGTGIGLAIVQRIVRHHGGQIWAYAEVDKGATFSFALGAAGEPDRTP